MQTFIDIFLHITMLLKSSFKVIFKNLASTDQLVHIKSASK